MYNKQYFNLVLRFYVFAKVLKTLVSGRSLPVTMIWALTVRSATPSPAGMKRDRSASHLAVSWTWSERWTGKLRTDTRWSSRLMMQVRKYISSNQVAFNIALPCLKEKLWWQQAFCRISAFPSALVFAKWTCLIGICRVMECLMDWNLVIVLYYERTESWKDRGERDWERSTSRDSNPGRLKCICAICHAAH